MLPYDRVDRELLQNVLKIYGTGGQLMEERKVFHREANACIMVNGELSDRFPIGLGVRQECAMLPWLFNIFMDG